MSEAYLPLLRYIILQFVVAIIGNNISKKTEIGFSGILKSWIFGQMLCFAVFQLMAVPMILLRWKFNTLFWSYLGVCGLLFAFGVWRLIKRSTRIRVFKPELSTLAVLIIIIATVLFFWQAGIYFFGIHLDEDDSRFLAQANDALEYGHMLTSFHETGEYTGLFNPERDATSPWVMIYAVASRVLNTTPSIFAHTIYPPVELFAVYGTYWLIGRELFKEKESQFAVVLLAIIANLFFTTTVYTQSTFSLVRIWQGKASVAAMIVPMIIYLFICVNKHGENNLSIWIMIVATGCASCLMSGAGIPLSVVAITVLGLYSIIAYQQWKRIPLWLLSLITPLGSGFLYMYLKG